MKCLAKHLGAIGVVLVAARLLLPTAAAAAADADTGPAVSGQELPAIGSGIPETKPDNNAGSPEKNGTATVSKPASGSRSNPRVTVEPAGTIPVKKKSYRRLLIPPPTDAGDVPLALDTANYVPRRGRPASAAADAWDSPAAYEEKESPSSRSRQPALRLVSVHPDRASSVARTITVPKTMRALRKQLGQGFDLARRGPFLIASDLRGDSFAALVDGVIACARECLNHDYFRTPPRKIITLYVLRNEKSYTASMQRLFGMKPISPYGHYGHSLRYIVINYDTGPGTLVHELTHALMAADFPEAPIWISEGIASLYEQCRVEGNSLKGDPNWRLPELKTALANKKITPLSQLLTLKASQFRLENESLHYAESRYFCKFMEAKGVLRRVYREFRQRHGQDRTGRKFVEKAFGKKLPAIEAEWHAWLKQER